MLYLSILICTFFLFLAEPLLNILSLAEPIYMEPYNLICRATFIPKIAPQLIPYLVLEWIGPDGVALTEENGVTIEQQQKFHSEATRSLMFYPLNMTHSGTYKCEATLFLPESNNTFISTSQYSLSVLSEFSLNPYSIFTFFSLFQLTDRSIIQLRLRPMIHCSKWFEHKV